MSEESKPTKAQQFGRAMGLIAGRRFDMINKEGRTIEKDFSTYMNTGYLTTAAVFIAYDDFRDRRVFKPASAHVPGNELGRKTRDRLGEKNRLERLIEAAALIAADIDIILAERDQDAETWRLAKEAELKNKTE